MLTISIRTNVIWLIVAVPASPPQRVGIESIPPATANRGVWIDFNGARWYSAGPAVTFAANRFTPLGAYRGYAVYRRNGGATDEIYVTATLDGPVAPYRRQ